MAREYKILQIALGAEDVEMTLNHTIRDDWEFLSCVALSPTVLCYTFQREKLPARGGRKRIEDASLNYGQHSPSPQLLKHSVVLTKVVIENNSYNLVYLVDFFNGGLFFGFTEKTGYKRLVYLYPIPVICPWAVHI